MLNGLDLFSGIGGISLALAPWVRPIAYCEIDQYCRGVLLSRQVDGSLQRAPIWDDVRTLRGDILPSVDIVYGGFPCQDLSAAGKRRGLEGERSGLFFEIVRLADECSAPFVFLENVWPLPQGTVEAVRNALEASGYQCRDGRYSAADAGAFHRRNRWFLLATHIARLELRIESGRRSGADREGTAEFADDGQARPTPDADSEGQLQQGGAIVSEWRWVGDLALEGGEIGTIEPCLGRGVHGVPASVDRLRALGNAVVPAQAREAFVRLMGLRVPESN